MLGMLKSLQSVFTSILTDIPEGVKIVLEFVWKCRWFILVGFVSYLVYTLVMKVLPYLMWLWVIKSIFGSLSFLFL